MNRSWLLTPLLLLSVAGCGDDTGGGDSQTTIEDPFLAVPGDGVQLSGVTEDNLIIFRNDDGLQAIEAIEGAATSFITEARGTVFILGRTVALFDEVNWETRRGQLYFWSPDGGTHELGTAFHAPEAVSSSDDASYFLFASNMTETTMDIHVVDAGMTSKQTIVEGAGRSAQDTCGASYGFAGPYIFVSWCGVGSQNATLERFRLDSGTWQPEIIATDIQSRWSASDDGEAVFFIDRAGGAHVNAGGTEHSIDRGVAGGSMHPDGSSVFYTVGDQLRRAEVGGSTRPIVTNGYSSNAAWSDGLEHVLYSRSVSWEAGAQRDLLIASTEDFNPMPIVLVSEPIATMTRSAFTGDGEHVIYLTDIQESVGTLHVQPITGEPSRTFDGVDGAKTGAGGTIVFTDNRSEPGTWPMTADLNVYKAGDEGGAVLLESGVLAGSNLYLTQDREAAVYVLPAGSAAGAGVWVRPLR